MKKIKLFTWLTTIACSTAIVGVLSSCGTSSKTDDIVIEGGGYDKTKSKIELHKESYIYLTPEQGKSISEIESVIVGGKTLTPVEQYLFEILNDTQYKLTIYASAMTSLKIQIKPVYGDPTPSSVQLSESEKILEVGETFNLTATLKYSSNDANASTISWSQEIIDQGVIEFETVQTASGQKNQIKAKKAGTVKVRARSSGVESAPCLISIKVPSFKFDTSSMTNVETNITDDTVVKLDQPILTFKAKADSNKTGKFHFKKDAFEFIMDESVNITTVENTYYYNFQTAFTKFSKFPISLEVTFVEDPIPVIKITQFGTGPNVSKVGTITFKSSEVTEAAPNLKFDLDTTSHQPLIYGYFTVYKQGGSVIGSTDSSSYGNKLYTNLSIKVDDWEGLQSSDKLIVDFVEVDPTVTSVTVGGNRNVSIEDSGSIAFTATNGDGKDISAYCTFTIKEKTGTNQEEIGTFSGNILTLNVTNRNVAAIVTAKSKDGKTGTMEIETGSFGKLDEDSLKQHKAVSNGEGGSVIVPSRYWDSSLNTPDWVEINTIPDSGMMYSNITGIYIPDTVTTIGKSPFGSGLTTININSANPKYTSCSDNNCNCIIEIQTKTLAFGCAGTTIPAYSSVCTSIGPGAFMHSGLVSITIPSNILSIGEGAFAECSALTGVEFDGISPITSIPEETFLDCESLANFTVPANVDTIGARAFVGCNTLTIVDFTTTSIDKWIQIGDANLDMLNVSNSSKNAQNLRDQTETPTVRGYNWAKTGITYNQNATKYATIKYDQSSFESAGVPLEIEGCAVEIKQVYGTAQKISIINSLNHFSAIGGTISITNSAGQVIKTHVVKYEMWTEPIYEQLTEVEITSDVWTNIAPQDELTVKFIKAKRAAISHYYVDSTISDDVEIYQGTEAGEKQSTPEIFDAGQLKVITVNYNNKNASTIDVYCGLYGPGETLIKELPVVTLESGEHTVTFTISNWEQEEKGKAIADNDILVFHMMSNTSH